MKRQINGRRAIVRDGKAATAFLAVLVLLMGLGVGGLVLYRSRPAGKAANNAPPAVPLTPEQKQAKDSLDRLIVREKAMTDIVKQKIPEFGRQLGKDKLALYKDYDFNNLNSERNRALERELGEIERMEASLKQYKAECDEALAIIASAHRGLERVILYENLADREKFIEEAQKAEQTAGSLIEVKLMRSEMNGPLRGLGK